MLGLVLKLKVNDGQKSYGQEGWGLNLISKIELADRPENPRLFPLTDANNV